MTKKNKFISRVEENLEISMFASRWFMAPVYVVLSFSLAIIMLKVLQEFIHNIPMFVSMDFKSLLLFCHGNLSNSFLKFPFSI